MAARYPGQRARRGHAAGVVITVVAALAVGLGLGAVLFRDDSTKTASTQVPLCPGDRADATQRARAAACLLDAYMALANQPRRERDNSLREIVLPSQLITQRRAYRALGSAPVNPPGHPQTYSKITTEYASVSAVKLGTELRPGAYDRPDVGYSAWIVIVDSYASDSQPLANWYLGHFAIRWDNDRWWLSDAFNADKNATPMSYTEGPESTAFGPGWVAV